MRPVNLYDALDTCIEMMRQGASIDECLRRYPQYAEQLRSELESAQSLDAARPYSQTDIAAMATGRARLLGAVADTARMGIPHEPTLALVAPARGVFSKLGRLAVVPYALPAVIAMLLLGGAAFGVAAATGGSGPSFLSDTGDDHVRIQGKLEAIDATSLTISTGAGDVVVLLDANTKFEAENNQPVARDAFVQGVEVKADATRNGNGDLVAREVELEADEQDKENADATPVASPTADQTNEDAGPGPNAGPGNAEDPEGNPDADEAEEPEDNSGPGNAEDRLQPGADNSGPGNAEDNSGPGNGGDEPEEDNSGPG